MKLSHALGLTGGEAVAFVGAGGKTSAMFALAGELPPPVIVTTSTHLGGWQTNLADQHCIFPSQVDFSQFDIGNVKTILINGLVNADNRLAGLESSQLEKVFRYCQDNGYSLLIEADGARQRPLKAPAEYEPVIPPWVGHVVVMAGLSGLDQTLTADTVHRPEIYAQLAGLSLGEDIRAEHVAHVLTAQNGGLKGIPEGAARNLFLNQAEGDIRMAKGAWLANRMADNFDRVLIGSLHQPNPDGPIFSVHSRTAGIILAAGGSERLGQPKQMLDWCGKPFVVQIASTALTAGLDPVIVVTGAEQARVEEALADLPVKCVHNPQWKAGQSTSMKAGLAALPGRCERVMILLSDQPQVSPMLIRGLIERHNVQQALITAPMVRERRGNPVLFAHESFNALSAITGDQGGRGVFNKFKVNYLNWIDERVLLDVDRQGDYDQLINAYFQTG